MESLPQLERLASPPIVEVVCGIRFERIADIDPLVLGAYWNQLKRSYPKHQLHPALVDQPLLLTNAAPARVWLLSEDDAFVAQLQWDRFYLNWRRRSAEYPRFSDHRGGNGLLSRTIEEFDRFSEFCSVTVGTRPLPQSIELSKIDVFRQAAHWSDWADLGRMLPLLAGFSDIVESDQGVIGINISRTIQDMEATILLGSAVDISSGPPGQPVLKMESRAGGAIKRDIRTSFEAANRVLNGLFATLIPKTERDRRFGGAK